MGHECSGAGSGSGTGGIGGLVPPISGRTLPPTAVQRAKPMDIRVIVLLIETSCLYSPPSEGKSRRAVRLGVPPARPSSP